MKYSKLMTASVLIEVAWDFKDGSPDWKYCMANAAFSHKEACEFVVHVGTEPDAPGSFYSNELRCMQKSGCSQKFIEAYSQAKKLGAVRVLFYT